MVIHRSGFHPYGTIVVPVRTPTFRRRIREAPVALSRGHDALVTKGAPRMLKRARRAGLVPALVVTVVVAISLVASAAANRFNSLAAVCGYGYGYPATAPTVTSVAPNFGPPTGGTTVTI